MTSEIRRGCGLGTSRHRPGLLATSALFACALLAGGATPTDGASQLVMLAGLVLVVISLMVFTHRRVRRAQNAKLIPARKRYNENSRYTAIRSGIDEAITQLDQLARQVHGQLDTRFAKLEAVIRDADERIERLSKLSKRNMADAALDVTLEEEDPLNTFPAVASAEGHSPSHAHANVWRLADSGMSAPDIAKDVGKLTGEVELILSLRRARDAADAVSDEPMIRATITPSTARP